MSKVPSQTYLQFHLTSPGMALDLTLANGRTYQIDNCGSYVDGEYPQGGYRIRAHGPKSTAPGHWVYVDNAPDIACLHNFLKAAERLAPLQTTYPTPTEPGWYWLIAGNHHQEAVCVSASIGDALVYWRAGMRMVEPIVLPNFPDDISGYRWGGPIAPPSTYQGKPAQAMLGPTKVYTLHSDEADGSTDTALYETLAGFKAAKLDIVRAHLESIEADGQSFQLRELVEAGNANDAWDLFMEVNAVMNGKAPHGFENYYHAQEHELH